MDSTSKPLEKSFGSNFRIEFGLDLDRIRSILNCSSNIELQQKVSFQTRAPIQTKIHLNHCLNWNENLIHQKLSPRNLIKFE